MNRGASCIVFVKPSHCMQKENVLCLVQEVATMANEDKKDFNAMLHDSKDMPKMKIIHITTWKCR